jgi:hypothetical protein
VTFYAVGAEGDSLLTVSGDTSFSTSTNFYDNAWARGASGQFAAGSNIIRSVPFSLASGSVRFNFAMSSYLQTTVLDYFALFNQSGTPVVRAILGDSTAQIQWQFWDGAAWNNIGPSMAVPNTSGAGKAFIEVQWTCGVSGNLRVLISDVEQFSLSVNLSAATAMTLFRMTDMSLIGANYISELIISEIATVGHRLKTVPATSNGLDINGTGSYLDIDDTGNGSDADVVSFSAAAQKQSFKGAARTLGSSIRAVVAACRAWRVDATGPQNMRAYIIVSGTRYYGPTIALDTAPDIYQHSWDLNPATGVYWTPSEANAAALEWGFEALA